MVIEIISECGKNQIYQKSGLSVSDCLSQAKKLALAAKQAGASTCKWQCHESDEYPKRGLARHEWIKRNIELTPLDEFWNPLIEYHKEINLPFLCTPMSRGAAIKINPLVDRFKVGSADVTDLLMLRYIAETKKPVILSTGMSTIPQIKQALDILTSYGSKITLMHCVSMYPCQEKKLNLNTIRLFKKGFPNFKIGFSDHSYSLFAPSLAVAMGAEVIEKHFTLDKNAWGPDHLISLIPREFKKMVQDIRRTEHILGIEDKLLYNEEKLLWQKFRV